MQFSSTLLKRSEDSAYAARDIAEKMINEIQDYIALPNPEVSLLGAAVILYTNRSPGKPNDGRSIRIFPHKQSLLWGTPKVETFVFELYVSSCNIDAERMDFLKDWLTLNGFQLKHRGWGDIDNQRWDSGEAPLSEWM
jgi:hypothetical protein